MAEKGYEMKIQFAAGDCFPYLSKSPIQGRVLGVSETENILGIIHIWKTHVGMCK